MAPHRLDIIQRHGSQLSDGRVARVGQHVAAVGWLDPPALQQCSQHLDPSAAAHVGGRNHTPIGTAGSSTQQQALGRGEFEQGVYRGLPYLA